MELKDAKIAIIGLGYVGLPLAIEFSKKYPVFGFDINKKRIEELSAGNDLTLEVSKEELAEASLLSFTCDKDDLKQVNIFIVTVPTPIDDHKQPDLTPLIRASEMIGTIIKENDVVIYESTVYPGATEEDCIPVIEKNSGLKFNLDFFAGYSPERINPGDKERRVANITKITSGSTPEIAEFVDSIYSSIIKAGTHKASSIKVAEAAKVIENVQRDVNIALVNEIYQILNSMNINTSEVIEAASTKWNFMKLHPGLVGGHCISVDPYYLLHRSGDYGFIPDLIRKSREINDGMSYYVAMDFLKSLVKNSIDISSTKVLILGFSFKPDCPDIRNTKVFDLYNHLVKIGLECEVYDPIVDPDEVRDKYGINIAASIETKNAVGLLAVEHEQFDQKFLEKFNYAYRIKS